MSQTTILKNECLPSHPRVNTMRKNKQIFVGYNPHPKPSEILGNPSSDLHRLSVRSYIMSDVFKLILN